MSINHSDIDEHLEIEYKNDPPKCSDFDEDCEDVEDKLHCYLYDPQKGYCPYLRTRCQNF